MRRATLEEREPSAREPVTSVARLTAEEDRTPEDERCPIPVVRVWKVAVPETFRAVVEAVVAVIIVVEA